MLVSPGRVLPHKEAFSLHCDKLNVSLGASGYWILPSMFYKLPLDGRVHFPCHSIH